LVRARRRLFPAFNDVSQWSFVMQRSFVMLTTPSSVRRIRIVSAASAVALLLGAAPSMAMMSKPDPGPTRAA
jgi:hypothetical protein